VGGVSHLEKEQTMKIPMPTYLSPDWHQQRKRDEQGRVRFGASDAPALMGVSEYKTIADLLVSKTMDTTPSPTTEAQMRGHRLEPALLSYAEEVLRTPVFNPECWYTEGRFVATLDGLTPDNVIVEAKTTTAYSSDDSLPASYYWQVCAQFACVPEADTAVLAVLDKRMRFGHWVIDRYQPDIDKLLEWADYVGSCFDRGLLPKGELLQEKHVKVLYPNPEGVIELDDDGFGLVAEYCQVKAKRETLETKEKDLRNLITAIMGNNDTATYNGNKVVTYKSRNGGSKLDTKLLEAEHPELVAQYKRLVTTTRVLRTY
jgi:putative phage-type endonuclease